MKLKTLSLLIIAGFFLLTQCKEEDNVPPPGAITDQELYDMSATTAGFTWYKNDSSVLASSPESAHGGFVRFRFNSIAQAALTDNGKLPAGASFPEGSLIVKELHGNISGTDLNGYAIMLKAPNDPDAARGWVWAEYFGTINSGTQVVDKGNICTGCHSRNLNRDYTRVFDLFP